MKILNIDIKTFGPFTDFPLDFSEGTHGLHILFGPNEAGKSSALRALKSLLYGIPTRSNDNFLHDYKKMLIGAKLSQGDGSEIEFQRRKGNANTLIKPNGDNLDDHVLDAFLMGVDVRMFETVFGLNHERLTEGGQEILKGGGEVGSSIFSTGLGVTGMRKVLESLWEEAGTLFTPQARQRAINKALETYKSAIKEISNASLRSSVWEENEQELSKSIAELGDVEVTIREIDRELNRLTQISRAVPIVADLGGKNAELRDLKEATELPPDFPERRRKTILALETAVRDKKNAEESIEHLKTDMKQKSVDADLLLDHESDIERLKKDLSVNLKALRDAESLKAKQQQLQSEASNLLTREWKDRTLEELRKLRPSTALRSRIRKLGENLLVRQKEKESIQKNITRFRRDIASAEESLRALSARMDADTLRTAIKSTSKLGDLDKAHDDATRNLTIEEENVLVGLKQLGLWSGTADELEIQPLPSLVTIDQFADKQRDADSIIVRLDERVKEYQNGITNKNRMIDELRLVGEVPTPEELDAAREHRDKGWKLVRRAWIENEDISDEENEYGEGDALPLAYEKNVAHTDDLSDRLRREASRVEKFANINAEVEELEKNILEAGIERENIQKQINELNKKWIETWRTCSIDPKTPSQMRAWIDSAVKLIERQKRVRALRESKKHFEKNIESARAKLITALDTLEIKPAEDGVMLGALLDFCETTLEKIDKTERHRKEFQQKINEANKSLEEANQELKECEQMLSNLQSGWSASMEAVGLMGTALPEEASVYLDKLEEVFKKLEEADGYGSRISTIVEDEKRFAEDVSKTVARLVPEMGNWEYEEAVNRLDDLRSESLRQTERFKQFDKQLKANETKLKEAEDTISEMTAQINDMLREAQRERPEELIDAEAKSAKRIELKKEIKGLQDILRKDCEGITIEELIRETKEIDTGELRLKINQLEQSIEEQNIKRDELNKRIAVLEEEHKKMDGAGKAAEEAERAQSSLATVRMLTDRFVKIRTAAIILNREIERFRAENQDPILKRAGKLFAMITLGNFTDLQVDYNESDQQVIVGVRGNGERVSVEGMSDGTCDQLYLALRLAHIEKYLETNEPFPFIADDILIRFDDERSMATLQALADLSEKTQVLFFTHHTRLKEMAVNEAVSKGRVFIHNL